MRRRRSRSVVSTRIPIPTLSGGVGRQPSAKRLPAEAENMDNALVSLERSFEKRPGLELLDNNGTGEGLQVELFTKGGGDPDYWQYWFKINEDNRYVLIVDYQAADAASLLQVFKINTASDGTVSWEEDTSIDIDEATYNYITYGNGTYQAKEVLKAVTLGTQVIILNKKVKAGFTSDLNDSDEWKTFGLDGVQTTTDDILGPKIQYYTSVLWDVSADPYALVSPGDMTEAATIPVEDARVNIVATNGEQGLADFSEIEFPPDENDWFLNNSLITNSSGGTTSYDDDTPSRVLSALHDPDHPFYDPTKFVSTRDGVGDYLPFPGGLGKIYYAAQPFLSQPSGYYRVVSFEDSRTISLGDGATYLDNRIYDDDGGAVETSSFDLTGQSRPYTQRVRTPDAYSVLDKLRMPHKITFDVNADDNWTGRSINWTPRLSGDRYTNPGPSVFLNGEKTAAVQREIKALSVYRGRLFFAAGNVLFSSQQNDASNLWIEDPTAIVNTDPLDVIASSNTYAEITSMVPFNNFLFVNTKGDIQFELTGSENQITPLTAELSPTAFYSTAPLIDPVLIGSQIYFFDAERLYIYFSETAASINSAVEVSAHASRYLPENFRSTISAPAQDMILTVDDDYPSDIYLYINRFSGDQVIQNAFFRYRLTEEEEVLSMRVFDNYLYVITEYNDQYWLSRTLLREEDTDIPRIDRRYALVLDGEINTNVVYDPVAGTTTYTLPYMDANIDQVILGPGWGNDANISFGDFTVTVDEVEETTDVVISGQYNTDGRTVYFGSAYTMTVELSTQHVRDDNNNMIDGTLNLRTMILRHKDTGDYSVEVYRRGRDPLVSTFSAIESDLYELYDPTAILPLIEEEGEFVAKVLGFSDSTVIKIVSSAPTPVNITNIELKGKFKQTYTSLST